MRTALAVTALGLAALLSTSQPAAAADPAEVFSQFVPPEPWQERFWAEPGVSALLTLDPKALADLVPAQAGVRFCRCPACGAPEEDDPLSWSPAKPAVLACRRCRAELPNDKIPAKDDKEKKVPEETIEVFPGKLHRYPYHVIDSDKQRYPDERVYLAAKRDYEAREFLAKAALYAAARAAKQPRGARDPRLTRLACVLLLRFAQVYPAYAIHFDQPNQPKYFQAANLPPPYRHAFKTGKWDWIGSLDVPLNLLIAYALLRDDPAVAEAGRALNDPHPARTVEHDLFRAAAEFTRLQPDDFSERSLQAYRGMLAVGRLVGDPALVQEVRTRLAAFAERGFYHDGMWRQGDSQAHQRVVALLDGWIGRLLAAGATEPPVPMLDLARAASGAPLADPRAEEVRLASWPHPAFDPAPRQPKLLGGVGLARLAVGQGADAFDLDIRGLDSRAGAHFQRLAVRLAVGGTPVLGDLDDQAPTSTGWERATAAHNTVLVDGLNQRESATAAGTPAPGANVLFFAADPDFQVVSLDDKWAYPTSTTRYRHTVAVSATPAMRYAVSVFEVHGGLQHDQVFHAAAGLSGRWEVSVPPESPPASLLPASIVYVPSARAEDGRWFVQAFGEFALLGQAQLVKPAAATLRAAAAASGVRLHLLGDGHYTLYTAETPNRATAAGSSAEASRAALVLRRRSTDGSALNSTLVTVYEPLGAPAPLRRVGRVHSSADTVVVYLESAAGSQHLVFNLVPGRPQTVHLADGRQVRTDAPVVRVDGSALVLAGGSFAEMPEARIGQPVISGRILRAGREAAAGSRGWFEVDTRFNETETLAGRTLLVQHGDGSTHGWTIHRVERSERGTRIHLLEEPGFLVSDATGEARYYQFPRTALPGPHEFWVLRIAR